MKQGIYKVLSNVQLTDTVYKMVIEGDTSDFTRPGQFVNFTVEAGKLAKIEVVSGDLFITAEQLAAYTDAIVATQDVTIDMVAGATVDCQAVTSALTAAFAN